MIKKSVCVYLMRKVVCRQIKSHCFLQVYIRMHMHERLRERERRGSCCCVHSVVSTRAHTYALYSSSCLPHQQQSGLACCCISLSLSFPLPLSLPPNPDLQLHREPAERWAGRRPELAGSMFDALPPYPQQAEKRVWHHLPTVKNQ